MSFQSQSIEKSEIGSYLTELRRNKNISLEICASKTGISLKYLKALEEGDFDKLPGLVYAKNFLKIYINFLDGDIQKGIGFLESAGTVNGKKTVIKKETPKAIFTPRRIELGVVFLIIFAVFGYFFYEARFLSAPPNLEIFYPGEFERTAAKIITVDGRAGSEAKVFINEEQIFVDANGLFKETVDLQNGLNTITIQAINKKGKTATAEKKILVEE